MCLKAALVCMEVPFIFVCFGLTYYFLKGDSENLAENGIYYCVHMVSQVAMSTISTFWLLLLCHSSSYSSMFVSVGNRVLQMDRVTVSHAFIVVTSFLDGFRIQQDQLDEAIAFEDSDPWLASTVLAMLVPILGVEYLVCSNAPEYAFRIMVYHLKTLPSLLALQMQIISFILEVMKVNIKVRQTKLQLQILARELSCRWPQSKQKPQFFDQQIHRVKDLKRRYNDLHYMFVRINGCFGGSLLTIIIVYFALFVSNSYWLFVDIRTKPWRIYAILLNLGFIFNVALQMAAACWHCQQSYNLGRQIGCLISKLVKPQGSKRYNDLVSEFSLQTLHQRFVVTAKDFFSLNLHLLSSMFAAVVTYLVILIQFMFAERSSKRSSG
ncbi:GM18356 [Drosophila sechellia]|uniref:Gustatory receptor n=1 Tax=Drosophila sechellia TaxID=7238 RepID=B4I2N6_DROSE|nr:GM18356 [Drosophila sechellia]